MKFIDLDECVLNALELFCTVTIPKIRVPYKHLLVAGSGNAIVTGQILFHDRYAIFADESTYEEALKDIKEIDGVVIVSASGGKHAPIIARQVRRYGKKSVLITNNGDSEATKLVDRCFVFPKNPEPYTYNTSTYMGMILGLTHEEPKRILDFIRRRITKIPDFSKYNAFCVIIPDEMEPVRELFITKFDELFGPKINGRVFTVDQMKHAKTIVPSEKECFIGIGVDNRTWGTHRYNFPLPKDADFVALMAIGYYLIGKIQKQHPPWFKRNIVAFTKKASKVFGQKIDPIVE